MATNSRAEIRQFLMSRRARISPQSTGIADSARARRVPGLRREEVAQLAGLSADYYRRLERGNLSGVSDTILDALARVLRLDDAERAHLFGLAATATTSTRTRRHSGATHVRPSIQRFLDAITRTPAWIQNDRLDVLAVNPLAQALYTDLLDQTQRPANFARYLFFDSGSHDFYLDWPQQADHAVAVLRSAAGRNPYDERLTKLVGELSTRSSEFRSRWATHDVADHYVGQKTVNHAEVGQLVLRYEAMQLPTDPGLTLFALISEPGSPTEERINNLRLNGR
jgi:transcriptional regulator with XRE-family HTH domain